MQIVQREQTLFAVEGCRVLASCCKCLIDNRCVIWKVRHGKS